MKKDKHSQRSKIFIIAVLVCGLLGLLVINTDSVTAEKKILSAEGAEIVTVDQNQVSEKALVESVSVMPSLLKLFSAMVLVIGLIYGVLYLFKKMMGNKYSGNGRGKVLEVLETTYLGPKKTVSLIRFADKAVLVGSTDGSMTALGELDEAKTKELLESLDSDDQDDPLENIVKATSVKFKAMTSKNYKQDLVDSQV